jgi:hypothetical protein
VLSSGRTKPCYPPNPPAYCRLYSVEPILPGTTKKSPWDTFSLHHPPENSAEVYCMISNSVFWSFQDSRLWFLDLPRRLQPSGSRKAIKLCEACCCDVRISIEVIYVVPGRHAHHKYLFWKRTKHHEDEDRHFHASCYALRDNCRVFWKHWS